MKQANVGTIALRAVSDAELVVGTHEIGDSNAGPEVDEYLKSVGLPPGNPWCAAFVVFRLTKAAHELGLTIRSDFPRTGYTPTLAGFFKNNNLWTPASARNPLMIARGDLCFFYFAAEGRIGHVGMVTGIDGDGIHTIEGNTSGGSGVDRNGGGVYQKVRSFENFGTRGGFGRVPF